MVGKSVATAKTHKSTTRRKPVKTPFVLDKRTVKLRDTRAGKVVPSVWYNRMKQLVPAVWNRGRSGELVAPWFRNFLFFLKKKRIRLFTAQRRKSIFFLAHTKPSLFARRTLFNK